MENKSFKEGYFIGKKSKELTSSGEWEKTVSQALLGMTTDQIIIFFKGINAGIDESKKDQQKEK